MTILTILKKTTKTKEIKLIETNNRHFQKTCKWRKLLDVFLILTQLRNLIKWIDIIPRIQRTPLEYTDLPSVPLKNIFYL